MMPALAPLDYGRLTMLHNGPLVAGMVTTARFHFTVGQAGLRNGSRLRIGLPNTGWEKPVVPQQRYWDELVTGHDRRLAPFHPVNTTATLRSRRNASHCLEVTERMLAPDEDPAHAYWRWWITLILEADNLEPGDAIEILYGDTKYGAPGARIQTFPETAINVSAYIWPPEHGTYFRIPETPIYFDVISGPAVRANVVIASVLKGNV